ncbi:MAG: acyltransferase [Pseudomonadales bacterium]|nr:acyltransferase [Pseudomonadales bacterium]
MSRAFSLYLDAVRFLAAMLVLFYHANWIYRPGYVITSLGHEAVVIFFVLSGFVIAYVADTREQDFRGFMIARGARIFSVAIPAIAFTWLLDSAGFSISEAVYPDAYQAWSQPILRAVTSSFFLNEIWTLSIQLFSNTPYWSLNYEVWYYVLFGVLFFFEGRRRLCVFLLLCLLLGPKILLLLPVWWMGVRVYRSRHAADLPLWAGWLYLLLSIAGGYCYIHYSMAEAGSNFLEQLMGEERHTQLAFSRQFVSDYYLGVVLSLHFVAMKTLLARVGQPPRRFEVAVRYLAGATFSIYLFHQPLLWFFSAVFASIEPDIGRYVIAVCLTFLSAMLLSTVTERKKHWWHNWIVQLLALVERIGSRFRESFAR